MIHNDLDRHVASPQATSALLLIGSSGKSSVTALAIDGKRWRNTTPWRWLVLWFNFNVGDFQAANLIPFYGLKARIENR